MHNVLYWYPNLDPHLLLAGEFPPAKKLDKNEHLAKNATAFAEQ